MVRKEKVMINLYHIVEASEASDKKRVKAFKRLKTPITSPHHGSERESGTPLRLKKKIKRSSTDWNVGTKEKGENLSDTDINYDMRNEPIEKRKSPFNKGVTARRRKRVTEGSQGEKRLNRKFKGILNKHKISSPNDVKTTKGRKELDGASRRIRIKRADQEYRHTNKSKKQFVKLAKVSHTQSKNASDEEGKKRHENRRRNTMGDARRAKEMEIHHGIIAGRKGVKRGSFKDIGKLGTRRHSAI